MSWFRALPIAVFCILLAPLQAVAGIVLESADTETRNVRPGDSYRGTVVLRNTGKTPVEVKVYQTDYAFWADGRNDFGQPGKLARSNAKWLRLSQEQVSVPPGGLSSVQYELSVPQDARLTGTYWSVIMVEPVSGAEAGTPRRDEVQLQQVIRYAVQIISEIGETGKGEVAFSNAAVRVAEGKRFFTVDVENTGERWLRPHVRLELHDPNGRLVTKVEDQRQRIFPASSVRYRLDLSGVPAGKYLALLVADGGRNDLFGARIELDIP
jgi:hypothetical protein